MYQFLKPPSEVIWLKTTQDVKVRKEVILPKGAITWCETDYYSSFNVSGCVHIEDNRYEENFSADLFEPLFNEEKHYTKGTKVIARWDCCTQHEHKAEKGSFNTIDDTGNVGRFWFKDTPIGQGAFYAKDFLIINLPVGYTLPVFITEVPETFKGIKDPKDVQVGDYVMITKSDKNWNASMNIYVGNTYKVTNVHKDSRGARIYFKDSSYFAWNSWQKHFIVVGEPNPAVTSNLTDTKSDERTSGELFIGISEKPKRAVGIPEIKIVSSKKIII